MALPSAIAEYPTPSAAALKLAYVGKRIGDLEAPAAIMDAAVVRRNCAYMHDAVRTLGIGFRAHIKTHKTIELSKLQVGEQGDVRLLISTVAEGENLVPWLLERKAKGDAVNIIYALPLAPSRIPRLAQLARLLGPGSVSMLVDHPQQVVNLERFVQANPSAWPGRVSVLVKIDAGYHRAGLAPESATIAKIAAAASDRVVIVGAYCHQGHSYASNSPQDAMNYLKDELTGAAAGAETLLAHLKTTPKERLIVTIGASPTATATQTALALNEGAEIKKLIASINEKFNFEIHAGVYPVMDMQQLAAAARPGTIDGESRLTFDNLGLRVMVEVASVYDERSRPEALIAAGSIVLGREPCKSYSGWAVVTPWSADPSEDTGSTYDPSSDKTGWIVGRISQEHGILTWEGPPVGVRQLEVGQKLLVWPNHACMAGPSFGWYYVVDSDSDDKDVVRDIWVRSRGW